jgi:phage terminase large subunit-like protein
MISSLEAWVPAAAEIAWWGTGVAPTQRWPGVTIPIDEIGGKYRFDAAQADRVCAFFPRYCSHQKAPFAGQPFEPLDYQTQLILRPIFGWVNAATGLRRFQKAYIEIPKKNGKTQLIAGLALYMLLCDNEPGAEVYVAAADREQARILFKAACAMVEHHPQLKRRCVVYRNQIVRADDPSAFFQTLSAEAATKHGPNIHCLIIDELHAQPDRDLYETLTRGVIARRQPLILEITTAGDDDESICVAPNTRILTSDLRWIQAAEIEEGDVLVGFDEEKRYPQHRKWRKSIVERVVQRQQPCYELKLTDGTKVTCSEEHMWLVMSAGRRIGWKRTKDLTPTDQFFKVAEPWTEDKSWESGYLAGIYDGEGHLTTARNACLLMTFTQRANGVSEFCKSELDRRGFRYTVGQSSPGVYQFTITKKRDVWRLLGSIRPRRLLERFDQIGFDRLRFKSFAHPTITSMRHVGIQDVVSLRTSSRTFVAEGLASHNCFEEYDYAKRVLSGTIQDEQFLPVIFEASPKDDPFDPAIWAKVNPGMGVTIQVDKFESEALQAKNEPRKRNGFLRYNLNRWTNQATAWIPLDWWDACKGVLDDAELVTLDCAGGLDLAQKWDLACFAVVFRKYLSTPAPEVTVAHEETTGAVTTKTIALNYQLYVRPFFWIPENTMREHEKNDGVPYTEWAKQGLVTPTEGDIIDYARIYQDITTKILPRYPKLKQGFLGYDPAFATDLATKLRDLAGLQPVEILQNYKHLSEPSQVIEALIKGQRLTHDGHRVLRSHWENIAVKTDDAGRIRPVKPRRSTKRIDGAVATIIANAAASLGAAKPEPQFQMFVIGGPKK